MEGQKIWGRVLVVAALCALMVALTAGAASAVTLRSIAGTVTLTDGAWSTATLRAVPYSQDDSGTWVPFAAGSTVASGGVYTIPGLAAGTYRVAFVDLGGKYPTRYWDSIDTSIGAATNVVIDTANVKDINIVMAPTTYSIKGHVNHAAGDWADSSLAAVPYQYLYRIQPDNKWAWAWTAVDGGSVVATDGAYSIDGLAPGTYRIGYNDANNVYAPIFYSSATTAGVGTDVSVTTTNAVGVDQTVTPLPELKVSGHVAFVGATPVVGDVYADVYSQDASGTWVSRATVPVAADGTYAAHLLTAGTYRVGFSDSDAVFADRFYAGASIVGSATDIAVAVDAPISGINETMTAQASAAFAGSDAIATALQLCQAKYADAVGGTVVVCTADGWADSVCAGAYAEAMNAPLLLVHKNKVATSVLAELGRLDADEVVIVGGSSAVSSYDEQSIRRAGVPVVRRLEGDDKYGTSAAVAQEMISRGLCATGDDGKLVNVAIVGAKNSSDALFVAPVAASQAMPVLLVKSASIPSAVQDFLDSAESTNTSVLIVGPESAVSADLESQLTPAVATTDVPLPVDRVTGDNKYMESVAMAQYAMDNYGFSARKVALVSNSGIVEALAASPFLAERHEAVVLTASTLTRKLVADSSPRAYTWLSPATEVFISAKTNLDPDAAFLPNPGIAVIDSIGQMNSDVYNYALNAAGIN